MDVASVKKLIEGQGFRINSIDYIPEGRSHDVFGIVLNDGRELIARCEMPRKLNAEGERRDFHYNGILSLEREARLCKLVKDKIGLPAPKVVGNYKGEQNFLLVEKLPGKLWCHMAEDCSVSEFLRSLELLGADLAKAHKTRFSEYGDLEGGNGTENLGERMRQIMQPTLEWAKRELTSQEFEEVNRYFSKSYAQIRDEEPCFILGDVHPSNFLVADNLKPCGYFDLEFCQAGVPAMEFFVLKLHLLNFRKDIPFSEAESALYKGYGGAYTTNRELENILSVKHMLMSTLRYKNEAFKDLMFEAIKGNIDYVRFGDCFRAMKKKKK